jgi:2-methylisocitrate lyase-like PEP mutase family enzyme
VQEESPLQVVGAINANHALLAKRAGFKAIYLSGGGVAAGSLGLPDLGISNLDDVLTDVRRITDVCDLPLLVDVDTGFGSSAFNVARTVKSMINSALRRCILKIRSARSVAVIVRTKKSSPSRKWLTVSKRQSMRVPMKIS